MSTAVKRKRGRPRLDEPREIKDFDNNLIQEFKKYPVFYDRQHPQHRNREYTDRIWQNIAQNLNVSANLAKTRMLQLRNRFNLEKRRVEALREQNPNTSVSSQWSLFENLLFLGDYVKTRRPYSLPASNNPKNDSTGSSSDAEDDEEEEEEVVSKTHEETSEPSKILTNNVLPSRNQYADQMSSNRNYLVNEGSTSRQLYPNTDYLMAVNKDKYKAFGQFLASSLIEMNEVQALSLVEKFTTELVNYLKTEERKKNSAKIGNTIADDENSLSVY